MVSATIVRLRLNTNKITMKPYKIIIITFSILFIFSQISYSQTVVPSKLNPPENLSPNKNKKSHIWISGEWIESNNNYVWKKGYWENKRPGFIFLPGYWKKIKNGWTWISGYWKQISIEKWNEIYS